MWEQRDLAPSSGQRDDQRGTTKQATEQVGQGDEGEAEYDAGRFVSQRVRSWHQAVHERRLSDHGGDLPARSDPEHVAACG